ncbi:MAG: flagellar assembly protein FliW [Armatimonadetes bacterium]|nr:flagellar assembly protein FliW [Armatimonadota bacterium]
MKVATTRFGLLDIDDSSVVKMVKGPVGFEEYTRYCLIQHRPDTSFRWLQSVEEPSLAFVVADPSQFFTDYDIELSDADVESLRLEKAEDAMVLTIISISDGGKEITANLAAPIVINTKELIAMQVILQDNRYSVKHPLVVNRKRESTAEAEQDQSPVAEAA